MKKLILLAALCGSGCSPNAERKGSVFEVAVYSIKKDHLAAYPEMTPKIRALLGSIKGFRSIRTMASLEKPGVFIDYCEWESLDDATAAGEIVMKMPEFQPIFAMMDSVYFIDHLKPLRL